LNFLAIKPSKKSVIEATVKINREKKIELLLFEKKKNKKNGTRTILIKDRIFGII